MKNFEHWLIAVFAVFTVSCNFNKEGFQAINSESFHESQLVLGPQLQQKVLNDSILLTTEFDDSENANTKVLDEMLQNCAFLKRNTSDSLWNSLVSKWEDYKIKSVELLGSNGIDTSLSGILINQKWAELNVNLLKLSGQVRFGDVLEELVYSNQSIFPERLLKSFIYTRIDDHIFINLIGSSHMTYQHTTGGSVTLSQQTNFPESNEMILKCNVADKRFMSVFIRIPSWAKNPSVAYGNVKYVAHAGEYCEISRKWKDSDEILVSLKN